MQLAPGRIEVHAPHLNVRAIARDRADEQKRHNDHLGHSLEQSDGPGVSNGERFEHSWSSLTRPRFKMLHEIESTWFDHKAVTSHRTPGSASQNATLRTYCLISFNFSGSRLI